MWLCPGFHSFVSGGQFTPVKSGVSWGNVGWIVGPVTNTFQRNLNEIRLVALSYPFCPFFG